MWCSIPLYIAIWQFYGSDRVKSAKFSNEFSQMGECFQDEHRFAKMFSHMGECSPIWEKISQVERAPAPLLIIQVVPDLGQVQGTTRGHSKKLYIPRSVTEKRKNSFYVRMRRPWNSLSEDLVNAHSVVSTTVLKMVWTSTGKVNLLSSNMTPNHPVLIQPTWKEDRIWSWILKKYWLLWESWLFL